jgi:hypothetical protein
MVVARKDDDFYWQKIVVAKFKEVKTGWSNLAESSKKGYFSKSYVLPMMMIMMMKNKK